MIGKVRNTHGKQIGVGHVEVIWSKSAVIFFEIVATDINCMRHLSHFRVIKLETSRDFQLPFFSFKLIDRISGIDLYFDHYWNIFSQHPVSSFLNPIHYRGLVLILSIFKVVIIIAVLVEIVRQIRLYYLSERNLRHFKLCVIGLIPIDLVKECMLLNT